MITERSGEAGSSGPAGLVPTGEPPCTPLAAAPFVPILLLVGAGVSGSGGDVARAVGIDLGTTHSAVAVFEGGS